MSRNRGLLLAAITLWLAAVALIVGPPAPQRVVERDARAQLPPPRPFRSNALPVLTGAEAVGVNGGTTNFGVTGVALPVGSDAGLPEVWAQTGGSLGSGGICNFGAGTWTQLTGVSFTSSTNIVATLPAGSYTVGDYNLVVFSSDGGIACGPLALPILAVSSPQTILGACLGNQWIAANFSGSSGAITSVADTNGGAAVPLNFIGAGGGTINTSDPEFSMPGVSTITTNSTSQYLCTGSDSFASSTRTVLLGGAFYYPGSGSTVDNSFLEYETSVGTSAALVFSGALTSAKILSSLGVTGLGGQASPLPNTWLGWNNFNGGSPTLGVELNNQAVATGSSGVTTLAATSGHVCVGASYNGGTPNAFNKISFAELITGNCVPTATQIANLTIYYWSKYGVTSPPSFVSATEVPSVASAQARILGTSFMSGVSFSALCGATTYPITTSSQGSYSGFTYADVAIASALPVGTCDLIMTNLDGRSRNALNALTVKAANADPYVCAMAAFGTTTVGLYGSNYNFNTTTSPCTSSNVCVSSWLDQSQLANHEANSTSSEYPIFHAADGTFGAFPYIVPNGSSDTLFTSATPLWDGAGLPNQLNSIFVAKVQTSPASAGVLGSIVAACDFPQIPAFSSRDPQLVYSNTLSWGTALSAGVYNLQTKIGTGGTPATLINVSNSGSPVTGSSTCASGLASTQNWYSFSKTNITGYSNVPTAFKIVLNTAPGSTALSTWESCAQALFGANTVAPVVCYAPSHLAGGSLLALLVLLRRRRPDNGAASSKEAA